MPTTRHSTNSRNTKTHLPLTTLAHHEFEMDDEIGTRTGELHPDDLSRNNILASLSADEIEFLLPHLDVARQSVFRSRHPSQIRDAPK